MIHALHLLWIVPAAAFFGFCLCALLSANGREEDDDHARQTAYPRT